MSASQQLGTGFVVCGDSQSEREAPAASSARFTAGGRGARPLASIGGESTARRTGPARRRRRRRRRSRARWPQQTRRTSSRVRSVGQSAHGPSCTIACRTAYLCARLFACLAKTKKKGIRSTCLVEGANVGQHRWRRAHRQAQHALRQEEESARVAQPTLAANQSRRASQRAQAEKHLQRASRRAPNRRRASRNSEQCEPDSTTARRRLRTAFLAAARSRCAVGCRRQGLSARRRQRSAGARLTRFS